MPVFQNKKYHASFVSEIQSSLMKFTAEHCAVLLAFASELDLSRHEILDFEGKDSLRRGPFELTYIDANKFEVLFQSAPQLIDGPFDLGADVHFLRQFLPIF